VSVLEGGGISVEVPTGWEGSISDGRFKLLSDGARDPTVLHISSFPLPAERGSFGSGAVELMNSADVLMVLFEYQRESVGTPLFSASGIPRNLRPDMFDRNALQRTLAGQSGLQQFFTHQSRAFCLYVVLGSHLDRADLVPEVNGVLESLEID
jgi:hypothetical protein